MTLTLTLTYNLAQPFPLNPKSSASPPLPHCSALNFTTTRQGYQPAADAWPSHGRPCHPDDRWPLPSSPPPRNALLSLSLVSPVSLSCSLLNFDPPGQRHLRRSPSPASCNRPHQPPTLFSRPQPLSSTTLLPTHALLIPLPGKLTWPISCATALPTGFAASVWRHHHLS